MPRDGSASPSEGEIVESGSDKANTITNVHHGRIVDRPSRNRVSVSRSPSPYRSPGPYRARNLSRDRSRSPYRESRGSKRQREDDHYEHSRNDSRRFKVRYEDPRAGNRGSGHSSRRELHLGDAIDGRSTLKGNHSWDGHANIGRRDMLSKSTTDFPGHHGQPRSRFGRADTHSRCRQYDDAQHGARHKYISEQSVSNRSGAPIPIAHSRHEAESSDIQMQSASTSEDMVIDTRAANATLPLLHNAAEADVAVSQPQLDEALLIEERRKKREAIKAKHKGQATPLLEQALAADNAPKETQSSSAQASPRAASPITPKSPGALQSPTEFVVTQDTDLANDNATYDSTRGEDEPSAADYDPIMDMQEDKLRYGERPYDDAALRSGCVIEMQRGPGSLGFPQPVSQQASNDFDMFAEGDDTDIFAQQPSIAQSAKTEVKETAPAPQVKAVDMGMLDDWDDDEGYYKVKLGELLDGRYHVQSNLGKGMFSGVVRATDQNTKEIVAIKVVRNNETMYKAGQKEIGILRTLRNADLEDKKHLIRLERSFEHRGHLCMVFENLSINLREVLKKFGRDIGINLKAVRAYAQQMLLGLSLLRRCNILHADLKPDNILVNETRNVLKICDLGSAADITENEITQYLVSRFYRAPEIILGLPYDFAIDMWSVGCTLFELYTGKILFTGRNNNQMLRVMMECRGKFSHKMLRKAQFAGYHFDDLLNFKSIEKDRLSGKDTVRLWNPTKPTRDLRTRLLFNVKGMSDAESKEVNSFADLLDRCLCLNPEKRCTPAEALKHAFISKHKA